MRKSERVCVKRYSSKKIQQMYCRQKETKSMWKMQKGLKKKGSGKYMGKYKQH